MPVGIRARRTPPDRATPDRMPLRLIIALLAMTALRGEDSAPSKPGARPDAPLQIDPPAETAPAGPGRADSFGGQAAARRGIAPVPPLSPEEQLRTFQLSDSPNLWLARDLRGTGRCDEKTLLAGNYAATAYSESSQLRPVPFSTPSGQQVWAFRPSDGRQARR